MRALWPRLFLAALLLLGQGNARAQLVGQGGFFDPANYVISVTARNIASFIRAPGWMNAAIVSLGNTQNQTRLCVWNDSGSAVTNIQAVYSTWMTQGNGSNGESALPNSLNETASLEYPIGTRTQFNFSGSASTVMAGGLNTLSDPLAVTIPAGAQFCEISDTAAVGAPVNATTTAVNSGTVLKVPTAGIVQGYAITGVAALNTSSVVTVASITDANTLVMSTSASVPSGSALTFSPIIPLSWGTGQIPPSSSGESGTALTNKTLSGTIGTAAAAGYAPSAILGVPTSGGSFGKVSMAVLGDSLTVGAADGNYATHGGTGIYGRSADSLFPYMSIGVTGTTAVNQVNHISMRADLLAKAGVTHLGVAWASNDIQAGTSASTLMSYISSIANSLQTSMPGVKLFAPTVIPRVTITGNAMLTQANQTQTAPFAAGSSSVMGQFNAMVRAQPSFLYRYYELSDAISTGRDSGYFLTGSGSHTTALAQTFSAQSGSTTTSIATGLTNVTTNEYIYGQLFFTSGVDSGISKSVSANTAAGVVTTAAFASAPAANDNGTVYAPTDVNSPDGTHPNVTSTSGSGMGGIFYITDYLRPAFQTLASTG